MTVFITADHGGWRAKQKLVPWLRRQGVTVVDLGPEKLRTDDDYPVWAARLARHVQRHPGSFGIGLCRSGVGMAIAANKLAGIRAAQAFTPAMAKKSRVDEDANILSLGVDYASGPMLQKIILAWLKTTYRPTKRFTRRLRQLSRLDHGR